MGYKRIEITDDFMFSYAMRKDKICAAVIECLIPGIKISRIEYKDSYEAGAQTEKTIRGAIDTRSIRLDVYLDDGTTVFNVEMQTGNKQNLPKRSRFYASRIDCDLLKPGEDYNRLKPTYIVFICTFDPFGRGNYRYSFERRCEEEKNLKLGDESYILFFNTSGEKGEIDEELKKLLAYFDEPQEYPTEERTELIEKIEEIVETANQDAEWRREYMTFAQAQWDAKQEGLMIGRKEGRAEGRAEGKISALYELVLDGTLTVGCAAEKAGMSEEDFIEKAKEI